MIPKVSVLTPVYNVEKYLPQCLDSLKAQTLREIEFICINDGSTDGSLAILREYAEDDARFKIIDKQNEGYGKSMNRGIAMATGEYIGILESDDFIAPDAFERLYALAKENGGCDVVKANYFTFNSKRGERFVENLPEDLCGRPINPAEPENAKVVIPTPAIWSAIYRRTFLLDNGVGFLETPGAAFQDTGFVMKSFIVAKRVYLTHDAFVRYRVDNAGSSVKSHDRVFNVCEEYHSIEAFLAARPDKRPTLITAVNAAKFNTYRWNKNRIDWDSRPEFLEVFAREFRAAREAGELDETLSAPSRWREFNQIADDPQAYYERSRIAASFRELAGKLAATGDPRVAIVISPRLGGGSLLRTLETLGAQGLSGLELVLPSSLCAALPEGLLSSGVTFIDPDARARYIAKALARITAPYVNVLEDPVYHRKHSLEKMLAALEASDAGFAVVPLAHREEGKVRKLKTSKRLFKAGDSLPQELYAVDATLNNKLFRVEALSACGDSLDAMRVYDSCSHECVPGASMLTTMSDDDLLKRVPFTTRIKYRHWSKGR